MKKYILFLLTLALISSCAKNEIGLVSDSTVANVTNTVLNKKGICITTRTKKWSYRTHDLGSHWMYSWGNELPAELPENVEYVPMFWGKASVNDANIARLKLLKDQGKIKYILGFNEPDGAAQANMTVEEAIALWPRLEEIGLPLVSPGCISADSAWMKQFMKRVEELGLRVDYIAVHSYGGPNVVNFYNNLKKAHDDYKRPIWITEFAVADWTATTAENNKYSVATIKEFMRDALTVLDNTEWIYRYAWYNGRNAPLYTSSLFDDNSVLTELGQFYTANFPNLNIGPGQDTEFIPVVDPNELILNPGFETGSLLPEWLGYNNEIAGAGAGPNTGNFSGRIKTGAGGGTLYNVAVVEPGKTYVLKFWSKWNATITTSFTPTLRNFVGNVELVKLPSVPLTDVWTQTTYEYTIPAGVTQLRIQFYKANEFLFYLDDVSLKLKK